MFGASQSKPGALFGSSLNTNTQGTGGGILGNLGQNNQQSQQQQGGGGLFGNQAQNNQQNLNQGASSLFGNFGQSIQNQPQQQQNQQPQGFGGQQTQPQQTGGIFGLGQSQNNQQQQNGFFGGSQPGSFGQSVQQTLPQLGQSQALWQPNSALSSRTYICTSQRIFAYLVQVKRAYQSR